MVNIILAAIFIVGCFGFGIYIAYKIEHSDYKPIDFNDK